MAQRREGQTKTLPKSANTDPRTTHVAVNLKHGHKFFCRLDTAEKHGQDGVADEDVPGTYWITPCDLYGSCYNGSSLWQGGFRFIPLDEWNEDTAEEPKRMVPNAAGEMVEAPADLPIIVADYADGYIVWSRKGKVHQVRYGLQVHTYGLLDRQRVEMAADDFGQCVRHYAECEGLLDEA